MNVADPHPTDRVQSSAGSAPPELRMLTEAPLNCETPLDELSGWITPNELHFVRGHGEVPIIDPSTWSLRVEGDAVSRPLNLSLQELRQLPSRSQVCWLECAGNSRKFFEGLQGEAVDPAQLPWGQGAVSNAEWTGVSLAEILTMADISPDAVDVLIEGIDADRRSRPIPTAVALEPTTVLAYAMNGESIPPDHGFPVRAIVPGWIAASSIKWVGRIEVSNRPIKVPWNTTSYVIEGPDGTAEPLTLQPIKSTVALPWEARLRPGHQMVRGFAWSPHGRIAKIEYSLDRGESWAEARIVEPNVPLAWVRWEFAWDPEPGPYTIMTRATDEVGTTQPDRAKWNRLGYLFNAVVPHPVVVTE